MLRSLVGSEMCIRDRPTRAQFALEDDEDIDKSEEEEEPQDPEDTEAMDLGKLTRKKLPSSTFLPQAVMSFWAILSGCFLATTPSRPFTQVKINAFSLGALFDTRSTYSLAHAKWKNTLLNSHDQPCKGPLVKLCAANGHLLETCGTYRVQITINNKTFSHCLLYTSPSPRDS